MIYCAHCGNKLEEGVKFCPNCGSKITFQNGSARSEGEYDSKDISENKGISVLSYIGALVFIPMFARKKSAFARFHANQGLGLFIVNTAYGVLHGIIMAVLRAVFPYEFYVGRGPVYGVFSTLFSLVWILFAALAILGIMNAVKGKAKPLPITGRIKILK